MGEAVPVRVCLLGEFRLSVAGDDVVVPQAAQRVIAYVALQRRPVRRARLAGALWLDKTDHRASANLRSALWRLGKLGAQVIDLDDGGARLRRGVRVDVGEATAWAWRVIEGEGGADDLEQVPPLGELLVDWYDDWVQVERQRLHQLQVHALEGICRRLLDAGRFARAVDAALMSVAADPLRESAHRLLIEAYVHEGNLVDALRARRSYVAIMREELGVDVADRLADLIPLGRPVAPRSIATAR
jgi:DNA-binding SARP family transcriptional activator